LDESPGEIDPLRVTDKMALFFAVEEWPQFLREDAIAFESLEELAGKGIQASKRLIRWSQHVQQNISAIKTEAKAIHDIDAQIELRGLTHPACNALTFMFRRGKENLEEGDVISLSHETLRLYETLLREAVLMTRGLERVSASFKAAA
jgi:hypothetical protein